MPVLRRRVELKIRFVEAELRAACWRDEILPSKTTRIVGSAAAKALNSSRRRVELEEKGI